MSANKKDHMKTLHERSGSVNSKDPLVSFLYILIRDHLPLGTVEGIMLDHVEYDGSEQSYSDCQFTNGWLAEYCKDLSERLKKKQV